MISRTDQMWIRRALDAEREVERLRDLLDRDRTGLAEGLNAVRKIVSGFDWICDGRGPYEWDDDRYRLEVGSLISQVLDVSREALARSGDVAALAFCPRARESYRLLNSVADTLGSEKKQ